MSATESDCSVNFIAQMSTGFALIILPLALLMGTSRCVCVWVWVVLFSKLTLRGLTLRGHNLSKERPISKRKSCIILVTVWHSIVLLWCGR